MQIHNLVVARYLDGRVLKGATHDFSPNRPGFHVEVDGTGEVIELRCRNLKALFFVKSFAGDPARQDLKGFVAGPHETFCQPNHEHGLAVVFAIIGLT